MASQVTVQRTFEQPRSEVFAELADFGGIYRFHPFVEHSPIVDGTPTTGVGSERVCQLYDGKDLHERIVEFEQDHVLGVEILRGSMPIASGVGQYTLMDEPNGGTLVQLSMSYVPKGGLLGKAADALVMRRQFGKMLDLMLAALQEHLRTGKPIPQGWSPSTVA